MRPWTIKTWPPYRRSRPSTTSTGPTCSPTRPTSATPQRRGPTARWGPPVCPSACLSLPPSVCLSVRLCVLSVCLSVCLCVCLSVCLFIHLDVLCVSVHLSAHLYTRMSVVFSFWPFRQSSLKPPIEKSLSRPAILHCTNWNKNEQNILAFWFSLCSAP